MEAELVPSTRVILWTTPRSSSSVFERSVRELSKVKVMYEPHQDAFFFGPERTLKNIYDIDKLTDKLIKYASYTYDYVDQRLLAKYEGSNAVFVKNMAFFIPKERYSKYVEGNFSTFKHSFLIRNPREAILSFWKVCMKNGFTFLVRDAYSKLYELFQFLQNTGRPITVIDSVDLLENPESIMQQYCMETGLPYDKQMLTWSPGIVQDWAEYIHYEDWHWNAMYSSGFNKGIRKDTIKDSSFEVPPIVEEEIQKAMPFYETMHKFRMTV